MISEIQGSSLQRQLPQSGDPIPILQFLHFCFFGVVLRFSGGFEAFEGVVFDDFEWDAI